jgi:hypothetical protein
MSENENGLSEKVDAAFRAAAATVIERATQTGTPVIVWEDGRINGGPGGVHASRRLGA